VCAKSGKKGGVKDGGAFKKTQKGKKNNQQPEKVHEIQKKTQLTQVAGINITFQPCPLRARPIKHKVVTHSVIQALI